MIIKAACTKGKKKKKGWTVLICCFRSAFPLYSMESGFDPFRCFFAGAGPLPEQQLCLWGRARLCLAGRV